MSKDTAHFCVTIAEGQALVAVLRGWLLGICLPTYVLDIPDGRGKVPVGPGCLFPKGGWQMTDWPCRVLCCDDPALWSGLGLPFTA